MVLPSMNRFLMMVAAAAALLAVSPPAHASGSGSDGPVHIYVAGTGLKVRTVEATLAGHHAGAKAQVSLWQHRDGLDRPVRDVTRWKSSTAREVRGVRYERVAWRLNRSFPNKSKLCVSFTGQDDRLACVTIHR